MILFTIIIILELNIKQQIQVESLRQEHAIIDNKRVKQTLENLKFPLHFIDYETYASAVPKIDELGPHKHLVFQVSIHTLQKNIVHILTIRLISLTR